MDATAKDALTPNVVRVTADIEVGAVAQLFGNEAMMGVPVVFRHRGDPQPDVIAIVSAEL